MADELVEVRAFVRRPGMELVHKTEPGAIVAKIPGGFVVAHPDRPPYLLRHDGSVEAVVVQPVDPLKCPPGPFYRGSPILRVLKDGI